MRRNTLATALAALVSACSAGPTTGPNTVMVDAPPSTTQPTADGPASFEVHEWGLLDVDGSRAALLGGPLVERRPAVAKKPVLYFHLAPSTRSVDVDVRVSIPGGSGGGIVEHFPPGALSDDRSTVEWKGVRVRKGSCPVTGAPTKESSDCISKDSMPCEAAELPNYGTEDSSCLELSQGGGPSTANNLFYRADEAVPALPFEIAVNGQTVRVTHARATDIVGPLVYIHDAGFDIGASVTAAPALGQSLSLQPPTETSTSAAKDAIEHSMRLAGLTDDEIDAFNRAWQGSLYGEEVAKKSPKAAPIPKDYLVFVMPASMAKGVSSIEITPPPTALKRFILVRVAI